MSGYRQDYTQARTHANAFSENIHIFLTRRDDVLSLLGVLTNLEFSVSVRPPIVEFQTHHLPK
jgi:hypothetical protein